MFKHYGMPYYVNTIMLLVLHAPCTKVCNDGQLTEACRNDKNNIYLFLCLTETWKLFFCLL
jgi:hypothetical protein